MKSLSLFACLGVLLICSGCGSDAPVRVDHSVSGTVKFKGQPVTEGSIQFEDPATGGAGSGQLTADGHYETLLPDGNYKVTVMPPLEATPDSENSPGGLVPKQVDNIPAKYQATDTSPLSATVSADKVTHDFEMMP